MRLFHFEDKDGILRNGINYTSFHGVCVSFRRLYFVVVGIGCFGLHLSTIPDQERDRYMVNFSFTSWKRVHSSRKEN